MNFLFPCATRRCNLNKDVIVKAIAYLAWSDEKLEDSEVGDVKELFAKYKVEEAYGMDYMNKFIDQLVGGEDDDEEDEVEADLCLPPLDLGEGVDQIEFLSDLVKLSAADGSFSTPELNMIHLLGEAMNLKPVVISGTAIKVLHGSNISIALEV